MRTGMGFQMRHRTPPADHLRLPAAEQCSALVHSLPLPVKSSASDCGHGSRSKPWRQRQPKHRYEPKLRLTRTILALTEAEAPSPSPSPGRLRLVTERAELDAMKAAAVEALASLRLRHRTSSIRLGARRRDVSRPHPITDIPNLKKPRKRH